MEVAAGGEATLDLIRRVLASSPRSGTEPFGSCGLGTDEGEEQCSVAPLSLPAPFFGVEARFERPGSDACGDTAWGSPGWRVFAARHFAEGDTVERCELLPLHGGLELNDAHESGAGRHYICRSRASTQHAPAWEMVLPVGYCPLYRRAPAGDSDAALLQAAWSADGAAVVLRAQRDVRAGEELLLAAAAREKLREVFAAYKVPQGRWPEINEFDLEEMQRALLLGVPYDHGACDPGRLAAAEEAEKEALSRELLLPVRDGLGAHAGAVRPGWSPVHGRGVFALDSFRPGDVAEVCPAFVLDGADEDALESYCMSFRVESRRGGGAGAAGASDNVVVLALGCGAMYNHSADPNVSWTYVPRIGGGGGVVVMRALQGVRRGEELFIYYGKAYFGSGDYTERDGSLHQGSAAP